MPVITWCLSANGVTEINPQWADFSRMPPSRDLGARLRSALDLYPCDVLFVHRDAEKEPPEIRRQEISRAAREIDRQLIPVVPIRMTEAWLLFDQNAIRNAAGNPNGSTPLGLPSLDRLESMPDPKRLLHDALSRASELNIRRRSRLRVGERAHRLANGISDFSQLRALSAFRALEEDVAAFLSNRQDGVEV